RAFLSVPEVAKDAVVAVARRLAACGFTLVATRGTAAHLRAAGLPAETINKVQEGSPHIVDALRRGEVSLVVNTPAGADAFRAPPRVPRRRRLPAARPDAASARRARVPRGTRARRESPGRRRAARRARRPARHAPPGAFGGARARAPPRARPPAGAARGGRRAGRVDGVPARGGPRGARARGARAVGRGRARGR